MLVQWTTEMRLFNIIKKSPFLPFLFILGPVGVSRISASRGFLLM